MKFMKLAAVAIGMFASSSPAFADGNIDIHGGISRTCVIVCSSTAITYGAGLGYDFDVGKNVFVGIQGGIDSMRIDGENFANYSAVARVGTKIGESDSIYALGGYAGMDLKYGRGTANGYRLGGGYEHRFGKTLFAKIEYRYSHYSKYGYRGNQNTGIIGVGAHF